MALITVFNPALGPVFIDNAQCIPGSSRATVESTDLVRQLVAKGELIDKTIVEPVEEPELVTEPLSKPEPLEESVPEVPAVSFETTDSPVDEPAEPPKPASMKRRRKQTPPVKE